MQLQIFTVLHVISLKCHWQNNNDSLVALQKSNMTNTYKYNEYSYLLLKAATELLPP